jgi:hypothetical protein
MKKAEEILDNHLTKMSWTNTVKKNGNLYNTLIDAINEALIIHVVVVSKGTLCEWKSHNYEVINIGMCGKCNGMSEIN